MLIASDDSHPAEQLMISILFVILFFVILGGITYVSYRLNGSFKIDASWLALALAPFVIWLVSTNQLSEFSGFGLAFKLKQATAKPVSLALEGSALRIEPITSGEKGATSQIDSLIDQKVEAITLRTNRRGYANWAIRDYLERLTAEPFFKYVLFETRSGEFLGLIEGDRLLREMEENQTDVVGLLETSNLAGIGGIKLVFISKGSSREQALQLMDVHGLPELPVVDDEGRLLGFADRDKITSSIVAKLVASSR